MAHGDDFTIVGADSDLEWVHEELGKQLLLKFVGKLGGDAGDQKELRVLNRAWRWDSWGISYEADPRHAELLVKALGDDDRQPLSTPGVKLRAVAETFDNLLVDALGLADRASSVRTRGEAAETPSRAELYGPLPSGPTATRTTFFFNDGVQHVVQKRSARRFITLPATGHGGRSWDDVVRRLTVDSYSEVVLEDLDLEATRRRASAAAAEERSRRQEEEEVTRRVEEVRVERARLQERGEEAATSSQPLDVEAASLYRAGAARANYLALDRADLTLAAKELCRRMSSPTMADLVQLRRLARYLVGAPRLLYSYPWQASAGIAVCVDTNFAGCSLTRKST